MFLPFVRLSALGGLLGYFLNGLPDTNFDDTLGGYWTFLGGFNFIDTPGGYWITLGGLLNLSISSIGIELFSWWLLISSEGIGISLCGLLNVN